MNVTEHLKHNPGLKQRLQEMLLSIERESHFTTTAGIECPVNRLALGAEHPMLKYTNHNSLVMKTPFVSSEKEALKYFGAIQEVAMRTHPSTEMLWPSSTLPDETFNGAITLHYIFSETFVYDLAQAMKQTVAETRTGLSHQMRLNLAGYKVMLASQLQSRFAFVSSETNSATQAELTLVGVPLDATARFGITSETLRFYTLLTLLSAYTATNIETVDQLFEALTAMANDLHLSKSDRDIITHCWREVSSSAFRQDSDTVTAATYNCQQGQLFQQQAWENTFALAGFDKMELSTQLVIVHAIELGIAFEVLDEAEQFLKLTVGNHTEYIKNTNMTSLDTYIAPLIMENKTVTKKILKQAGFRVPSGEEFATVDEAMQMYDYFSESGFVVKPKSTNFGLGISIFQEGVSRTHFQEAVEIAFKQDSHVLIEEFIAGTEYRFYVLDGKVEGIILRVPANIIGDGIHTIAELVAFKNEDPLRGTHYRKPLQRIVIGSIERLLLKTQGYSEDDIPAKEQRIYLRENSNVSTGGDSIDMTDEMDESYKQIAVEAVAALGAFVSGIDLMITDNRVPSTKAATNYGIIEANYNPAIHMHMFPYQGTGRPLAQLLLMKLFPELNE
ncbi:bifunctional glutamate--cysteine ligase GshA/glutathione synthetase GshB [Brochothrix campestris]|uniref:Bifunctional glutamate--cysteine ligase/glutathione synthetase n=1 Tax=Brochothrix campestris FSL F6-1037 TaxID=1265861 RepID=W7CXL3_9LIST|nr:bifunctional glutamate--cysteine ligase GshA/glutathione synthetase GshB [Brochothrix campestris]EUJ41722.1 bifunctional glutamate--cysteine ligase/glutathione synthetase [Brochothrix campestris FSL F6-1037]